MNAYPSGFRWVETDTDPCEGTPGRRLILNAPSGRIAATVYLNKSCGKHVWFVWDEDGIGGENSSEPTVEAAKITAESAVLRWGRHFEGHPR